MNINSVSPIIINPKHGKKINKIKTQKDRKKQAQRELLTVFTNDVSNLMGTIKEGGRGVNSW